MPSEDIGVILSVDKKSSSRSNFRCLQRLRFAKDKISPLLTSEKYSLEEVENKLNFVFTLSKVVDALT